MPLALRWSRPVRAAARRAGLLRDPLRAAERAVGRWLDTEGTEVFERSGAPGLSVLVRFGDGRHVARRFGEAGPGVPMAEETLFQGLSLSKPVTALLALCLVDDGVLALDEPVLRRVPWRLPAHRAGAFDPDGITLRRLLSHSAGLSVHGFGWTEAGTAADARALLEAEQDEARTLRLVDRPGSVARYSGGGFTLVEHLIEAATGRPFAAVARARLLAPLGIEASGFEPALGLSPRLATRHDAEGRPLPRAGLASVAGASLVVTAADAATLWGVLLPGPVGAPPGRGVLSPAACRAILEPQSVDAEGTTCGLGFYLKERRGDLRYVHIGFDPGWNLHAEGLLRRRVVVVVLCNGDRGRRCVPTTAHEIRERLYDGVL